jgi:hypothetical protein
MNRVTAEDLRRRTIAFDAAVMEIAQIRAM